MLWCTVILAHFGLAEILVLICKDSKQQKRSAKAGAISYAPLHQQVGREPECSIRCNHYVYTKLSP